jgi:hypothetical protein
VTKTLGLLWDSKNDLLKYDAKPIDQKSRVTKRSVLSIIAQIFDPLGIIGAVITRAKIILQKLWSEHVADLRRQSNGRNSGINRDLRVATRKGQRKPRRSREPRSFTARTCRQRIVV